MTAWRALYNYDWPGNVRELINRVRRAIVMTDGRLVTAADLRARQTTAPALKTLAQARERASAKSSSRRSSAIRDASSTWPVNSGSRASRSIA